MNIKPETIACYEYAEKVEQVLSDGFGLENGHWLTPTVRKLCYLDSRAIEVLRPRANYYLHIVGMVYASRKGKDFDSEDWAAEFIHDLLYEGDKVVCEKYIDDCPSGLLGIFHKLNCNDWSIYDYQEILVLMRDHAANKLLRHQGVITVPFIEALSVISREYWHSRLFTKLNDIEEVHKYCYFIEALEKNVPEMYLPRVKTAMKSVDTMEKLYKVFWGWIYKLKFPEPPVAKTENLVPIDSYKKLCSKALEYKNCLKSLVGPVLDGGAYYYEWLGQEKAIVELSHDRFIGWGISNIKGIDNEGLGTKALDELAEEMISSNIRIFLQDYCLHRLESLMD